VEGAGARVTSRLSFVECGAAFARADRAGRIPRGEASRFARDFEAAWHDIAIVELDDEISRGAVDLVRDQPLRASDAIHLASALSAAPSEDSMTFACYDRRLWAAARALGFETFPPSPP
jgi:uncharacterized protein